MKSFLVSRNWDSVDFIKDQSEAVVLIFLWCFSRPVRLTSLNVTGMCARTRTFLLVHASLRTFPVWTHHIDSSTRWRKKTASSSYPSPIRSLMLVRSSTSLRPSPTASSSGSLTSTTSLTRSWYKNATASARWSGSDRMTQLQTREDVYDIYR